MTDASDVPSTGPGNSPSSGGNHPGAPRGTPVYSVDSDNVIEAIERAKQEPDEGRFHKGWLPMLDLPSFGEPDDNCGDPIPASMYFCPSCAKRHDKPHVCYRYDCPLHWAHAVRRRAAGSRSGAGVAPQLDALRRYLNAYRDDNQFYHHLVISLGDRCLAANDPLERELETIREIMDEIGIQGLVGYHPMAGDNEDHRGDDRGEWKNRIGKDTDWESVREELQFRPHFHILGVAPFVDFSDSPKIHEETGAVLHRIVDEEGKSISGRENEDTDDPAMCRALTYVLSHCGIYETDGGQRRLAAWMKGPDVGRITPLEKNKSRMQSIVYREAEKTLGIAPPNLKCDEPEEFHQEKEEPHPAFDREQRSPMLDAWDTGDELIGAASTGNGVTVDGPVGPDGPAAAPSGASRSRSTDLPARRDPFDSPTSGATFTPSSSSSTSSSSGPVRSRDPVHSSGGDETGTCGTRLRHISQANEYLLDPEWNEQQDEEGIREVEDAYRAYVTWMEARGYAATDDPTPLPEERLTDYPPSD